MARAILVEHQPDAPAGLLETWAAHRGLALDVVRPAAGDPWPEPAHAACAIVLGSDASVATRSEPWVDEELAWLRDADRHGLPVLGICFGAQSLAAALGGSVRRAAAKEIGWIELDESSAPVARGPWFAWHEDVLEPPPGATVLARNAVGVQAWARGPHLAVQFHPEVTPRIVAGWADAYGRALAGTGLDAATLAAQSAHHGPAAYAAAQRLFDGFAERAGLPVGRYQTSGTP